MDRRNFIKKTALLSAATIIAPSIIPSGRLFAATGSRKVNHVVFCLFAGGVRNIESVMKADGNLMPYTLNGSESISADLVGGMDQLPFLAGNTLQSQGTLFKEFRYKYGPTGHYAGHATAMTGVYATNDLNLKVSPPNPTIFEYYRKHNSPSTTSLNSWWVSNALGPYPLLNYSTDPNYGAIYGANYVQPLNLFSQTGYDVLANPRVFDVTEQTSITNLKDVLNKNFGNQYNNSAGIINPASEALLLENFITSEMNNINNGAYNDPWGVGGGTMNSDMYNIFFAERVIQEWQPELLVVNMQDVDIAHANFTQSCNNLRKADYALAHLWDTIQSTPGMADDTILIAVPEHGRNLETNTVMDQYGRYALDHTNDEMSRSIFCLMLGPSNVINQGLEVTGVEGESIDIVPTIANILGFDDEIPSSYQTQMGSVLDQAFVS